MEVLVSEPRLVMEGPLPEKMIFANAGSEPRVRNRRSGPWVREMSTFSGTGKLSHPRHTHLRVSCQEKGTSDTQRIDDARNSRKYQNENIQQNMLRRTDQISADENIWEAFFSSLKKLRHDGLHLRDLLSGMNNRHV